MREIKFRAWDNFFKQMYYFDFENNIEVRSGHLWIVHEEGAVSSKSPSVKIMQYTGSKDRNGTELYEKDIILFDSKRLFVIVFNKYGQFCVKSPEDLQDEIYAGYCIPDSKKIERIGNIYENPELLSKVEW